MSEVLRNTGEIPRLLVGARAGSPQREALLEPVEVQAKRIGDNAQYTFIRNSLKKTATIRKMLERQFTASLICLSNGTDSTPTCESIFMSTIFRVSEQ